MVEPFVSGVDAVVYVARMTMLLKAECKITLKALMKLSVEAVKRKGESAISLRQHSCFIGIVD